MRFYFSKSNLNIFPAIIALSLSLAGCNNDDAVSPEEEPTAPYMSFTITLSSENEGTRADDWNDNEKDPENSEEGKSFDNIISNVMPVIYELDDDGNLKVSSPVGYMAEALYRTNEEGELTIVGRLETNRSIEDLEMGNFRVAVFANTSQINPSDPTSVRFERFGAPSEQFTSIPMYGVGKANFSGLSQAVASIENPFMITTSGNVKLNIPLLRAMAKVRVKLQDNLVTDRQMKLISLSMSQHARTGYVVPKGWNSIPSTGELPLSEVFNLCTDGNVRNNVITPVVKKPVESEEEDKDSFIDEEENSESMIRFFVPDTKNADISGPIDPTEIALTVNYVSDGEEEIKSGILYFRQYIGGKPDESASAKPWNLIRNHIYEYTITGINPKTGSLYVTVDADWWGEHHLDLDFATMRPGGPEYGH